MQPSQPDANDAELVARARGGDKDAFGQLADRYGTMARNLARRMVAEHDLADDLTQEALLQAYLSLRHLRKASRFRSWLYGIVLNVCRNYLRDLRSSTLSLEELIGGMHVHALAASDEHSNPHDYAERHELNTVAVNAVQALPPKDRAATLLFYFEAFSVREVAEVLGMSDGAVRVHLHKARTRLKQPLGQIYEEATTVTSRSEAHGQPTIERRKNMVSVSIADVMEIKERKQYIVILLDEAQGRALPIWIGEPEAHALVRSLRNVSYPRPMTLEFASNLLTSAGVRVEEVHVNVLKDETFYSVVKLRNGAAVHEADARPSDALALAALMRTPIFVEDELLAGQGVDISDAHKAVLGRGLRVISERLQREIELATQPPDEDERVYREFQKLLTKQGDKA